MSSKKHIQFSDDFQKILLTHHQSLPDKNNLEKTGWYELDQLQELPKDEGKLICQALAESWEFMPNSKPPYSVKKPTNNKVIFFGGSFNPWHAGHEQCLKQLDLPNNTFVIPDNNPRKESAHKTNECVWKRYKELKEKISSSVAIYPGFWTNNTPNPTSNWLPQIKKEHPGLKLGMLIGFDSFITIHQWIKADQLLANLDELYIVSRLDNEAEKFNQIGFFEKFHPNIKLVFLGRHRYEDLSSTQLRNHS